MASISEILIGQADQAIKSTANQTSLADSIGKGINDYAQVAQVALKREELEQTKQQHALKAKEVNDAKWEKSWGMIKTGLDIKDPKAQNAYFKSFVPKGLAALGTADQIDPQAFQFATLTKENQARLQTLDSMVQRGVKTRDEAISILNDQQTFSKLVPAFSDVPVGEIPKEYLDETYKNLGESQKTAIGATAQENALRAANVRNEKTIEGAADRQTKDIQSSGQVTLAKRTAEDNAKFNTSGGQQAALAKIKKMEEVLKKFESGKIQTGGLLKKGVSMVGMQDVIDPELKAATDDMRAAISLKESLDSQFAQKEAEQQYNMRTIDPGLPTKANVARIRSMLQEAKDSYNNKIQTFKAQGLPVQGAEEAAPAAPAAAPDTARIQALYDKATPEQKKAIKAKAQAAGIKIKE